MPRADAITQAVYRLFWRPFGLRPQHPRAGDIAVVIRDHHNDETGLKVRVVDNPVFGTIYCTDCGQRIDDWVVRVNLVDQLGKEIPGSQNAFAYPIDWLQRDLPIGHIDQSKKQIFTG